MTWTAATGGTVIKYLIDASWGQVYVPGTSTSAAISGLSPNTQYTWRVKAINCNGSNPYTSTWSFTTGGPDGPEGPKTAHQGEEEFTIVPDFQLKQNYPNPFNPATRFEYGLPEGANVRLRIFNTLGQVVATVVDEYQAAGWKSAEYDAGNLPSGLYFYRLDAGRFNAIKKMMLVK